MHHFNQYMGNAGMYIETAELGLFVLIKGSELIIIVYGLRMQMQAYVMYIYTNYFAYCFAVFFALHWYFYEWLTFYEQGQRKRNAS